MNLASLHRSRLAREEIFPVSRRQIYCAHAAVAPLPSPVARAMTEYITACQNGHQELQVPPDFLTGARAHLAALIGAGPDEVSFVGSTSHALGLIAAGVRFQRGDNIVIYRDDYPSNVHPWLELRAQGIEVRSVTPATLGCITPTDVFAQVDRRTRLVALSSVHYLSGWRINVDELGAALQREGVLFCVDAIQSLGAFPISVEHVDFLAAGGHKWLLGPCGSGLLYVRRRWRPELHPTLLGWNNVECPDHVAGDPPSLRTGPERFEPGTQSLVNIVGLTAAVNLLGRLAHEPVGDFMAARRHRLAGILMDRGWRVLAGDAPLEQCSAILSFGRPGQSMAALHAALLRAGVMTSLRRDRQGNEYVRLSPHFYVTDEELERVLELVERTE